MEEYKKYFNLICYMIKNNFNQEFYSISQEIKRKLNINFSTIPLFVIFFDISIFICTSITVSSISS